MPITPDAEKRLLAIVDEAYYAEEREQKRVESDEKRLGSMLNVNFGPLSEAILHYDEMKAAYLRATGNAYTPPWLREKLKELGF